MQFKVENIGEYLKGKRKEAKLTLRIVAERTDLSVGYISRIENGSSSPSFETLYKLASVLPFKVEDICTFEEISLETNEPVPLENLFNQIQIQIGNDLLGQLEKMQMVKLLEYIHTMDWSSEINKIHSIHHILSIIDEIKKGDLENVTGS